MQAIVIRDSGDSAVGGRGSLLRYGLSTNPLNRVLLDGMDHLWRCRTAVGRPPMAGWTSPRQSQWILPETWCEEVSIDRLSRCSWDRAQADGLPRHNDRWVVVTDGRFATCVNHLLVTRAVDGMQADVIAVTIDPELMAYQERVRLTPDNRLVGYRRLFADSVVPMAVPAGWPHHLLVRPDVFEAVVKPNLLAGFDAVADACRARNDKMRGIAVAGTVFDLDSEEGMLAVCGMVLELSEAQEQSSSALRDLNSVPRSDAVGDAPRLIGPVMLGRKVTVEPGAIVVGPAVLCDDCMVRRDSVVDSAIVGTRVSVESGQVLRGRLAREPGRNGNGGDAGTVRRATKPPEHVCGRLESAFRTWPKFSYARSIKRVADVFAAGIVLVLFAPVIPVIALAVRMSSPGPIFFRDKRQGLHGKVFDCIKFRTMRQGADKMQDKLRFVCEVDGPQFKMADDPRITTVGRFLRETYLDEIPQFFNVLCGQMSLVGPRPSPELENTLCASWRDARLSVRPGITGLWQVCRTRAAHKDFQEWIHYDTQYVRNLSPGLDLWICWRTFRRMVENFVNQF
jgi:lipopolysaccharide/colanic/teichoic acid biosynthesis glycosyltransferase